ncbi:aldo/keto reductase [Anaerotruncus colihominis]|uniref:aldo/keto reductase n=1 Tax=Anaerotruncus colihominis TaxID=169435 RepID=UPI00399485F3
MRHVVSLYNGIEMPLVGLGVFKTNDQKEMDNAVRYAFEAGYRSFDTAQMYQNEHILGESLRRSGIARSDVFLTSKLDNPNQGYDKALLSFEESLRKLKTDYLDLFLIHWPGQKRSRLIESWRALERLHKEGRIRAIGVSNCMKRHLQWMAEDCDVMPAVNQIERHPLLNQNGLAQWCTQRGIQVEAWGPLVRGSFDFPQIREMAARYGKTPAQIILRWNVQSGYAVIPKSVHRDRIFENIDLFDFALDEADMRAIDAMDTGGRTSFDPETFDF